MEKKILVAAGKKIVDDCISENMLRPSHEEKDTLYAICIESIIMGYSISIQETAKFLGNMTIQAKELQCK